MSQQVKLLLIMLTLLVVAVGYAYFWYPSQETVSGSAAVVWNQGAEQSDKQSQDPLANLSLIFAEQGPAVFKNPKRDIFRPLYTPRKPAAKPKPVTKPKPKPVVKPNPKPVVKPNPKPVAKAFAAFSALGYLQKDNSFTVFLTLNNEIFLAKEGERFAEEYFIKEIHEKTIVIGRDSDNAERTLLLEKKSG